MGVAANSGLAISAIIALFVTTRRGDAKRCKTMTTPNYVYAVQPCIRIEDDWTSLASPARARASERVCAPVLGESICIALAKKKVHYFGHELRRGRLINHWTVCLKPQEI